MTSIFTGAEQVVFRCFVLLCLVICPQANWLFGAQQQDRAPGSYRWALICAPDLREQGLSELLTVEMTNRQGFELVERDLLDEVVRELELSSYSGAAGAQDRLSLGARLGADRLMLISREIQNEKTFLRVVICECELGARLQVSQIEVEDDDVSDWANQCEAVAVEARRRFAKGVRQIFGVAPFQSAHLVHDFDRYQKGFQYLLQSGLHSYPGVAVIEIEEARAIQQELAMSGRDPKGGPVMTLLGASYVFEKVVDGEPLVALKLSLQNGEGKRTFSPKSMTLEQTTVYLTKTIPQKMVQAANAKASAVPRFDQAKWLKKQAKSLANRGYRQDGVALYEAALLLEPNDVEVRRTIIDIYWALFEEPRRDKDKLVRLPMDNLRVLAVVKEREGAFLAYLAHLEYLIRNRLISANEAIGRTRTVKFNYLLLKERKSAKVIEEAEQDFIKRMKNLALALPRDFSYQKVNKSVKSFVAVQNEVELQHGWNSLRFNSVVSRLDRKHNLPTDFDQVVEVITKDIPDGAKITKEVELFFRHWLPYVNRDTKRKKVQPGFANQDDWQRMIERLLQSGHSNGVMIGKYAEMLLKLQRMKSAEQKRELVAEISQLIDDYDQLPYSTGMDQIERKSEPIRKRLATKRKMLLHSLSGTIPPEAQAIIRSRNPQYEKIDFAGADGVVREELIEFERKKLASGSNRTIGQVWRGAIVARSETPQSNLATSVPLTLISCGEIDVWWSSKGLSVMRQPGLVEDVIVGAKLRISDVVWDGSNIWVATLNGGIGILNPDKLEFSLVCGSEQGLPPAGIGLRIIDMQQDKILAVGSFGKNNRAWCGTVERKDDMLVVDVFHEATNVTKGEDGIPDWLDATITFRPVWISRFQAGPLGPTTYLVGRGGHRHDIRHRPLWIQPKLREAWTDVYHSRLHGSSMLGGYKFSDQMFGSGPFLSQNGQMFICNSFALTFIKPYLGHKLSDEVLKDKGKSLRPYGYQIEPFKFRTGKPQRPYRYFKSGGQVIAAGEQWFKLNPDTMEQNRYVNPISERKLETNQRFGTSAHYGLVGFRDLQKLRRYELVGSDKYLNLTPVLPQVSKFTDVKSALTGARDAHRNKATRIRRGVDGKATFLVRAAFDKKTHWVLSSENSHRSPASLNVHVEQNLIQQIKEKWDIDSVEQMIGQQVTVSGTAMTWAVYLTDDEAQDLEDQLESLGAKLKQTEAEKWYYIETGIFIRSVDQIVRQTD